MPLTAPLRTFGQTSKALRLRRQLSLKEVEVLSRQVARDSAGPISHPYLSQLESGRDVAISAAKLFSLAAIYAVDVDELIAAAPRGPQAMLADAVRQWPELGRP